MRIAVITAGSRGDVQPFVALALGLQRAGYEVVLGAPPNFADFAAGYGLDFRPVGTDTNALLQADDTRSVIESGNMRPAGKRKIIGALRRYHRQIIRDAWAIAEDADAIVYKYAIAAGPTLGHMLGIPAICAGLWPVTPTGAFPPPMILPPGAHPGFVNGLGFRAMRLFLWQLTKGAINEFRREQGYRPYPALTGPALSEDAPLLYAYSPSVLPRPRHWSPDTHVTGYWFLDAPQNWTPPADLQAFLESGPPPVFVGFGSMTSSDPHQAAQTVIEALRRTGQRGILNRGWGGLAGDNLDPQQFHMIDAAPFDWLFPRMAAVVHHGGAGTTATGFRAGVPSLIVWHNFDQPFWGWTAEQLGVGPAPISRKALTVEALAAAIDRMVSDRAMQGRAADLGERIRAEDGITAAVAHIGHYVGQPAQSVAVV